MTRSAHWLDGLAGGLALVVLALTMLIPNTALPWLKAVPALLWGLSFLVLGGRQGVVPAVTLGFAAAGDYFLAAQGLFLFGVVAFSVYQVLFGVRFWRLASRRRSLVVTVTGVYAAITTVLLAFCLPHVGAMAIPMAVYAVLLTATASGAAATGNPSLAVGGALFYLSDALILVFQVRPMPIPTDGLILVPYYLGQYLIVRGFRGSQIAGKNQQIAPAGPPAPSGAGPKSQP